MSVHKSIMSKIFSLIKNPFRIKRVLFRRLFSKKYSWKDKEESDHFGYKDYKNYNSYKEHQKQKLEDGIDTWIPDYDKKYRKQLHSNLLKFKQVSEGSVVLCLAARLGAEVRAFQDIGCFAVGIDLNPGPNNKYVLSGDFHDIQFENSTVDIVFSNSLDHAFNIEKLLSEVKRVLKKGGFFVVELPRGYSEDEQFGEYESFEWETIGDMKSLISNSGFDIDNCFEINSPFIGRQIYFKKN